MEKASNSPEGHVPFHSAYGSDSMASFSFTATSLDPYTQSLSLDERAMMRDG